MVFIFAKKWYPTCEVCGESIYPEEVDPENNKKNRHKGCKPTNLS